MTFHILITTVVGFYMASGIDFQWVLLGWTTLGTGLLALGPVPDLLPLLGNLRLLLGLQRGIKAAPIGGLMVREAGAFIGQRDRHVTLPKSSS